MGDKEGKGEKEKEKKKEELPSLVVLKVIDMHCEGCASKIRRFVKGLEGVGGVTTDVSSNKLSVVGKADPWMLKDRLDAKFHKKVEFVSPTNPPKPSTGKKPPDGTKGTPKELPASTVVLKIRLHCDACIQRIKKTILKVKGVQEVSVEAQKDLVTVKGKMDVNSLPTYLKSKLKRGVEIVPAKAAAAAAPAAGDKKDKAGGGGGGGAGGGGGGGETKIKEGGGEGGAKKGAAAAPAVEMSKMMQSNYGYRAEMMHAPQLFSDENPNACSVM